MREFGENKEVAGEDTGYGRWSAVKKKTVCVLDKIFILLQPVPKVDGGQACGDEVKNHEQVRRTVALERGIFLDVAQLVAHLVRDQEVAGSSPVIQTRRRLSEAILAGVFV